MGFPTAIKVCLSKYANFRGRAARAEFWWFQLFFVLLLLLLVAIYLVAPKTGPAIGIAAVVVNFGLYLPSLAVAVRRLHDRNRSGWHYLWMFAPFFGPIVLIIWWCQRGTEGDNRFGPDPLALR